jgi:hypothetical protein
MRLARHELRGLRQLAAGLSDCAGHLARRLLPQRRLRNAAWLPAFADLAPYGAAAFYREFPTEKPAG